MNGLMCSGGEGGGGGVEEEKGWGYSPFLDFSFFFHWGKLKMLTWNYHVLYL